VIFCYKNTKWIKIGQLILEYVSFVMSPQAIGKCGTTHLTLKKAKVLTCRGTLPGNHETPQLGGLFTMSPGVKPPWYFSLPAGSQQPQTLCLLWESG
jgi:hypothetical protein